MSDNSRRSAAMPHRRVAVQLTFAAITAVAAVAITPAGSRARAATASTQQVRVVSYNVLTTKADGTMLGERVAPWSQRRAGVLTLIQQSGAATVGIQEADRFVDAFGNRQIDSIATGLSGYALANTDAGSDNNNRLAGNYILYRPSVVTPVGAGGHWVIGVKYYAAYQQFRSVRSATRFIFVSVHLASARGAKYDTARGDETRSMLQQASAYAARAGVRSVVYVGDFNCFPGRAGYVDTSGNAMRAANFADSIQVAHSLSNAQYNSVNGYHRTAPKNWGSFDHVYAPNGYGVALWGELLNLSGGRFVGTIPSDHNPVYSDLQLPIG